MKIVEQKETKYTAKSTDIRTGTVFEGEDGAIYLRCFDYEGSHRYVNVETGRFKESKSMMGLELPNAELRLNQ